MLTKTLRFDDAVLEILKSMDWQNDGQLGILTCGQLDRDMYLKVNKALASMGGKWNRKAGGHVFKVDPREQVEGLLDSGELIVEKDGFFETPTPVIERMFELVKPKTDSWVLEPSAGLGAIVKQLIKVGYSEKRIALVEKNKQRARMLKKDYPSATLYFCDYLEHDNFGAFKRIYMNPPFEQLQDIDHVKWAYRDLDTDGAMVSVMGESAFFRTDKKSTEFREWLKSVNARDERLSKGAFKESGTMVNTRLIVIEK